ncbi:MAG: hypothetical protein JNN30_12950 [Rhodanobacteraceae bacterium]|nr:hypothetical protein [Rhodanobacteraceae bacterium]
MAADELILRDEWDCLISYLLRKDGHLRSPKRHPKSSAFSDPAMTELLSIVSGLGSYEWADRWVEHNAGIHQEKGARELKTNLQRLLDEAGQWEHKLTGNGEDSLAAWHRKFFRTAYSLPPGRSSFIGRGAELAEIDKALNDRGKVCLTAALTGVGGQGKTSLAMHYARTNQPSYAAIVAVLMEGSTARLNLSTPLDAFLRQYADWEGDLPKGSESTKVITLLGLICETFRGRVLVVVDDVPFLGTARSRQSEADQFFAAIFSAGEQPGAQLPAHLARRVRFLFTSRRPILTTRITNIPINPMTETDAVALFRSRVELDAPDGEILKLVSELLGCHPLSIVLVAAYAKTQEIDSIAPLIQSLQRRIVDAEAITQPELSGEEYPRSLIATLDMSYSVLSPVEKALLLLLSMFRRDTLRLHTIRRTCAKIPVFEAPDTAARLVRALTSERGGVAAVNQLCKLELLEAHGRHGQKTGGELYRLHQIVFDFAQHRWVSTPEGEFRKSLTTLETELTRAACALVSDHLGTKGLDFLDLETLAGLLVPLSNPRRGLIPQPERIELALRFWFDNYTFHNYVYDTGLQELLESQLTDLLEVFGRYYQPTLIDRLVVGKLLGHALYADPSTTGEKAAAYFDEALETARQLQAESQDADIVDTTRWYQLFLLDHRTNVRAKRLSGSESLRRLRTFPAFRSDLDEIESAFSASLAGLDEAPSAQDFEYIVRAAHYWGHRGNQDSQILLRRVAAGELGSDWDQLSGNATQHYIKALTFRLFASELFTPDRALQKVIRKKLTFLPAWMSADIARCDKRYEKFTSLAQGIGDAAHQLRGLHAVLAYKYLATRESGLLEQAQRALDEADVLWRLADEKLTFGEVPLKYRIWMESSHIAHRLLVASSRGESLGDEQAVIDQLTVAINRRTKAMKSIYHHAESQQVNELRTIYEAIKRF